MNRHTEIASFAAAPFTIRAERASDVPAREALLDNSFGANRQLRTCHRLREGHTPAHGLAFTATARRELVGTLRLWNATAQARPLLVLGPLAVDANCRTLGIGAALMRHAIKVAHAKGHGAIVLLGDAAYYERFGFSAANVAELALPGPFERERLLGLALRPGALDGARGLIVAAGAIPAAARLRAAA